MSFNRGNRNRLGPRFGEIMGKTCHAAITAAHKKNRAGYDKCVADIYQMLDTVETETWGRKAIAEDPIPEPVSEPVPTPKAVAESKPAAKSAGSKKPAKSKARKSGQSSD